MSCAAAVQVVLLLELECVIVLLPACVGIYCISPTGMVSGYGAAGGRGRCYTFWQDFFKCVETNGVAKSSEACWREWADYLECLHQRKMVGLEGPCKHCVKDSGFQFSKLTVSLSVLSLSHPCIPPPSDAAHQKCEKGEGETDQRGEMGRSMNLAQPWSNAWCNICQCLVDSAM